MGDNERTQRALSSFHGFIFDLDGVIYKEKELIHGAVESLNLLRRNQKKFVFVTNNTSYTRSEIVGKLTSLGIDVLHDQVLTVTSALIDYIKQERPNTPKIKVHLLARGGIMNDFIREGFDLTAATPDYVVIGWDLQVDYEKLYQAASNIRAGARFLVTSPDRYAPSARGLELGPGTFGASVEYATGIKPTYIGKPCVPMINAALAFLGTTREETVIVGDTPETDIKSHHMAQLGFSVLVLSGNTSQKDIHTLSEDQKPSLILNSILDFQHHFQ